MGKTLIIKGADFSVNCIENIAPLNYLINGYVGSPTTASSRTTLICNIDGHNYLDNSKGFVIFVADTSQGVLISSDFIITIPVGLWYTMCVIDNDGRSPGAVIRSERQQVVDSPVVITKEIVYNSLGVDENEYPYTGLNISRENTS